MISNNFEELSSSLRICKPIDTLKKAIPIAKQIGVTRWTEITWLDKIGVPVFTSIRPAAVRSSLCVNSGKGFHRIEAEIGCLMESLEFGFAELKYCHLKPELKKLKHALPSPKILNSILDYCPRYNVELNLSVEIPCFQSIDIIEDKAFYVPAELVLIENIQNYPSYFGTSSNGLCAGNNKKEAIIHGVLEVIERDIQSFQFVNDTSSFVPTTSLSGTIPSMLLAKIKSADLNLTIRYVNNRYNLPYFQAFVFQDYEKSPYFNNVGYGCHLIKEIALVRAICEAIQSRLVVIQGGRDDLIEKFNYFRKMPEEKFNKYVSKLEKKVFNNSSIVHYSEIHDWSEKFNNFDTGLTLILNILTDLGIKRVLTLQLNPPDSSLYVGRVIIPSLEFFEKKLRRVGPRLKTIINT